MTTIDADGYADGYAGAKAATVATVGEVEKEEESSSAKQVAWLEAKLSAAKLD